jgi:hypothetical protein
MLDSLPDSDIIFLPSPKRFLRIGGGSLLAASGAYP